MQFSYSGYLGPYIKYGDVYLVAESYVTATEDKTKLVPVGGGVMSSRNGPFAQIIATNNLLGHDPENVPGGARWNAAVWRPYNHRSLAVETDFQRAMASMDALLSTEVDARRALMPNTDASPVGGLRADLAVHQALIAEKTSLLAQQQAAANAFYGTTPIGQDFNTFIDQLLARSKSGKSFGEIFQEWNESFNAAYESRVLDAAVAQLWGRADSLRAAIDNTIAQDQVRMEAERLAAEAAKAEADRLDAEAAARAEAERFANTYPVRGALAVAGPTVITTAGTLVSAAAQLAIRASIGSAIGGLSALAGSVAAGFTVGVSALFYSSSLGNGELPRRYALQTPLSDLLPATEGDLRAVGENGGRTSLPYRISSRTDAEGRSEILVMPTDGQAIANDVRVLLASYDAQLNLYTATTTDSPPRTLTWTPIVAPGDSSTTSPGEPVQPPVYDGAAITPMDGRIDVFPEAADASFDDYVIVFPADSGLPPLYTMFQDRREEPGTMMGVGQADVGGIWLLGASEGEGVLIPSRIAVTLHGKGVGNWRDARKAIWKAVNEDPTLSVQFNNMNRARMKKGNAPYVPKGQRVGGREVFEIHHHVPISEGGGVYDIDNLRITTPQNHIRIHTGKEKIQ